jgi:hypothetical protein
MFELPDHPDVRRALRTGYSTTIDGDTYRCPVCKTELEADETVYTIYVCGEQYVIGCAECVETRTAEGIYA